MPYTVALDFSVPPIIMSRTSMQVNRDGADVGQETGLRPLIRIHQVDFALVGI